MKKILLILILTFVSIVNVHALDVDYMTKNITSNNYEKLQARYAQKELNASIGCNLVTDGVYGNLTKNCVKAFQKAYGISQTGWVGSITRNKLNELYLMDSIIVYVSSSNIRNAAGFNGSIVGTASRGKIFKVYGSKTANNRIWYKIYYNGEFAYISENSVKTTFVEVDIVSQTLRLYKNKKLILDTPITTGKADGKYDTNKGFHYALFKDDDRILQPSNSYVRYWIRFYDPRALGIHDADWRGMNVNYNYFGGNRYKTSGYAAGSKYTGSHGCVNVPVPKMKMIYDNVVASRNTNVDRTPLLALISVRYQ